MKIEVSQFIDSAHQLPDSESLTTKKCLNLHGHTYWIKVEGTGPVDANGMLVDFSRIKDVIKELDHQYINDVFRANNFDKPSTAENIARYLVAKLIVAFEGWGIEMSSNTLKVKVCEGYKGEGSAWVEATTFDLDRPVREQTGLVAETNHVNGIPTATPDLVSTLLNYTTNPINDESVEFQGGDNLRVD